jgi:hypothetical protein
MLPLLKRVDEVREVATA